MTFVNKDLLHWNRKKTSTK